MAKIETVDLASTTKAYYAPATITPAGYETIHISGQPGSTSNGHVPADYESQIQLALLNLRKIMITAGTTVKDITKLQLFIVNYDPARRKHTKHIQRFLGGHRPAITLVPVAQLAVPTWLFEIDATVARSPKTVGLSSPRMLSSSPDIWDVVVVGAGLAGLTAAHELQKAGLSFRVLEARDRVGGKTWSQSTSGPGNQGMVDMGAAWLNDVNQLKVHALAKRYGAELLEQNTTGLCVLEDDKGTCSTFSYGELPKFDASAAKDVARTRDMVEEDCQKLDPARPQDTELDALTFEAYLRSRGASQEAILTATVWTRAMLGQDPSDMSALYFLSYCRSGGGLMTMRSDRKGGGQHLRIRQGMQHLAKGLAQDLPADILQLSSPISQVMQQADNTVEVVTAKNEAFRARKVIMTVPSPVLKSITFQPKLPAVKQAFAESTTYGYYTKAMMVFKTPFWVEKGYCGLIQSFTGPASVIRDTSSKPDNKAVLTCFMSGDPGRAWASLSHDGRAKALAMQIGKLFSSEAEAERDFVELITYEWSGDEFAGWGCPCTALTPGVLDTVGPAMREPCGSLHFAGTETAVLWKGYMEGAVESGERAAAEVVNSLSAGAVSRL